MIKYQVGDEVYLGDSYWCGYTVVGVKPNDSLRVKPNNSLRVKPNDKLDVLISASGSMLDAFWVSSKELSFIC